MLRGVVWAYGISFVAGLVFYAIGLTPQTDPVLYPLLALLSGAIGVAVGLRAIGTAGLFHLVMLGLGLWLINLNNILLGTQTFNAWLDSSAFIGATVVGGRLLLGNSLSSVPAAPESSAIIEST